MIISPANRRARIWSVTLLLLLISQQSVPGQAARDQEFKTFWPRFRSAVVNHDKEAIASMTKFPFLYESEERTRASFLKIQDQLFTRKIRKCFATAKPLKERDAYDVFCGGLIFYFGKSDGEYKFLEFGADD
ncbi:MAG: hypothetical protein ABI967_05500 [bacterium]